MIAWLTLEGWEPVRPKRSTVGWRGLRRGDELLFVGVKEDYRTFMGEDYMAEDATDEMPSTWGEYTAEKLQEGIDVLTKGTK